MKTAISIPDPLFEDAEKLAQRLAKSRSQLYCEALEEYLSRHDPDTVTERLNAVYGAVEEEIDPFLNAVGKRILKSVEW